MATGASSVWVMTSDTPVTLMQQSHTPPNSRRTDCTAPLSDCQWHCGIRFDNAAASRESPVGCTVLWHTRIKHMHVLAWLRWSVCAVLPLLFFVGKGGSAALGGQEWNRSNSHCHGSSKPASGWCHGTWQCCNLAHDC